MLNIIRADLYRILRGKGFYITIGLLIGFIILQALTQGGVQIAVVTDDGEVITESTDYFTFAGHEQLVNTDLTLYFILAFIIFIACADFTTDTIKNVLSNGTPRVKYYLAKLILCCIFCVAVVILHVAISIITTLVIIEIMKSLSDSYEAVVVIQAASLIKAVLAQIFMCISVTCVGVFFVFATKRTAGVNSAYIAFCFVPIVLIFTLSQINNELSFLYDYELMSNMRMLRMIALDMAESADVIRAFAIGAFYIIVSTVGGLLIFKRSEIK